MTEAPAAVPAMVSAADDGAPERLAREAALELGVAVEGRATLHEPGQRERYRTLLEGGWPGFPPSDLELSLQPDRFTFAMPVSKEPGYLSVTASF